MADYKRLYVGAKCAPSFYDDGNGGSEWQQGVQYEPLTVVTDADNNMYISRRWVPAEAPLEDGAYWHMIEVNIDNSQTTNIYDPVYNIENDLITVEIEYPTYISRFTRKGITAKLERSGLLHVTGSMMRNDDGSGSTYNSGSTLFSLYVNKSDLPEGYVLNPYFMSPLQVPSAVKNLFSGFYAFFPQNTSWTNPNIYSVTATMGIDITELADRIRIDFRWMDTYFSCMQIDRTFNIFDTEV